jgi:hypothetical protein
VNVADSDGQDVDAGGVNKPGGVCRVGHDPSFRFDGPVLVTGQRGEFGLDPRPVPAGEFHHGVGSFDVVVEWVMGCIDHHRVVAGVQALGDFIEVTGVVEVDAQMSDRKRRARRESRQQAAPRRQRRTNGYRFGG